MVRLSVVVFLVACLGAAHAEAQPTPGYPEKVLQWSIQEGETCAAIAESLYGSRQRQDLLTRYADVACGGALEAGRVIVVPAGVEDVPAAHIESATPTARARPPDGDWRLAEPGLALYQRYGVNTLARGTADILFNDRSRVFLAEHTLVIIYGTALTSRRTSADPASVELDSGELQAGMAALRGRPSMAVATRGGGRVEAASNDTVLRRQGERTTVSVFDGHANVSSQGARVQVPKLYGTSFETSKAPQPPRPLPPAPDWMGDRPGVIFAPPGQAVVHARWSAIDGARAYRVELAFDRAFHRPMLRREVPAGVRDLRAEGLPVGRLYLRVRAIDDEDFLGLASEVRELVIVGGELSFGRVEGDVLRVSPYGALSLDPGPDVEVAVDDRPYRSGARQLSLLRLAPSALRFRTVEGGDVGGLRIEYRQPEVRASLERSLSGSLGILAFHDLPSNELAAAGLTARLTRADHRQTVPLAEVADGKLAASMPDSHPGVLGELVIRDARGVVLATASAAPLPPEPVPPLAADPAVVPPLIAASYEFFEPRARASAAAGVVAVRGPALLQGWATATARLGRWGVSGRLSSNRVRAASSAEHADNAAWLGARVALAGHDLGSATSTHVDRRRLQVGLRLRLALPVSGSSPPTRVEPAAAIGSLVGDGSWLVNAGARLAVDGTLVGVARVQPFAIAVGTWRVSNVVRLQAAIDASAELGVASPCGGASLGASTRGWVAVSVGLRASPCQRQAHLSLQGALSLFDF